MTSSHTLFVFSGQNLEPSHCLDLPSEDTVRLYTKVRTQALHIFYINYLSQYMPTDQSQKLKANAM